MAGDQGRTIKSVERACAILDVLQKEGSLPLGEVADRVGRSPGTVHTYLQTLQKHGFVRHEGRQYGLDPRLMTLGEHIRNHLDIHRAAIEQVDKLAYETGEGVHLFIERGGELLIVNETFGQNALGRDFYERNRGRTHPIIHATAAGKAILSHYSEEEVRAIVEEFGLNRFTRNTITDVDALNEELERVSAQGYALNDQEQMNAMRAVGAAITGPDQAVEGAISVSGPPSRLQGARFREELPDLVRESANAVEINLQSPTLGN